MERQKSTKKNSTHGSRLLVFFISIAFTLFSTGCGNEKGKPSTEKKLRIGLMITPRGLDDKGFNDLAYAGIKSAERKFGIDPVLIEPSTMSDPEASLRFFTQQNFDAIIAVGTAFYKAIKTISKERPNLPFFVIDSSMEEGNVRGISFREDEGSFLCGFLAAKMSKTKKIGFVGGIKNETILRFFNGYYNGAMEAASDTMVVSHYVSETFSGFNDPETARKIATQLYNEGSDVIFHAAGASGLGVISAAGDAKKLVIGVDMNQDSMAPGLVLTSMLKKVDQVVEDVVKTLSEGKKPTFVKRSYGMVDNAIDLTDFQFSRQQIGDELISKLGSLRKEILEGRLQTSKAQPNPRPEKTTASGTLE
ncbi:BMP family ABC transporter substrate-binding protein [bacterium]|nr:BMP family ABC transporter substrate-binding protein [bacterium]